MAVAHPLQPTCSRDARGPVMTARAVNERTWQEVSVAKEDRGFASMDRMKQREIASKGGKAAHQKGTAHEWTSEEAREAGRTGGMASHRRRSETLGGTPDETSNLQADEGNDEMSADLGPEKEQIR